ncbi:MAG TPA: O-antigen ligase family protein [Rudaea sp.]|nr:O-antigen ligase family protein [Rudaea sp.]
MDRSPFSTLAHYWPALVALLVLVLLPVGRTAEAPLAIGGVAGLVFAWRLRAELSVQPGVRLAASIFACYWLAALVSAPGAVAPQKTWSTVAGALRFLPFAVFAALALRERRVWPGFVDAAAAIVVLWLLDAWVQILTGYDIAGASDATRLSGIFGAGNLKLGPVLAVLSPFVFVAAQRRLGWRGLTFAFVFQLMPILYAGSRSGWLMFGLVALAFAWRSTHALPRFAVWMAGALCLAVVGAIVAGRGSDAFDARIERSLLALQGTESALDAASAGRLRIWGTAVRMIAAHPLTGVGVRGFRYAYPQFAAPGDAFVDPASEEGAAHAHQIVLEVLSETGVVGLALWLAGTFVALRAWRRAGAEARERAFAPALALAAMCFPFDTHLAFYSAWWGLLFWWLLALYAAALGADDGHGA